jgi:hypothetical protein
LLALSPSVSEFQPQADNSTATLVLFISLGSLLVAVAVIVAACVPREDAAAYRIDNRISLLAEALPRCRHVRAQRDAPVPRKKTVSKKKLLRERRRGGMPMPE